jgi:hypothetical protein
MTRIVATSRFLYGGDGNGHALLMTTALEPIG